MNRIDHLGVLAVVVSLSAGCAPPKDATTARLDDLQRELSRVKAANIALSERLDAVEAQAPAPAGDDPSLAALGDDGSGQANDSSDLRPDLDVIRLGPADDASDRDVEAPTDARDAGRLDGTASPDASLPEISGTGGRVKHVDPATPEPPVVARAPRWRR
ncbi:MAG: hypothetical protein AAF715_25355 [Myxococcota bacterium]